MTAATPLEAWARFRAARAWDVLVVAEGLAEIGTFTPEGCRAIAAQLPGVPVALWRSLEHRPALSFEAPDLPPEAIVGEILTAHHRPGVGVRATLRLVERKQRLHDCLLTLFAADALTLGPSMVLWHSGAPSGPDAIIADVRRIDSVDIVWCPGGGGRFLTPVER